MRKLTWYMWVLWVVVTVAALAISAWSMFTLGTDLLHMPAYLAAVASAIFDLGAMFLAVLSIYYAMSNESGFATELYAFLFMAVSAWINWQHASILNLPLVGMVMFASASVVSAVVLKALLTYLNKQSLESNGRTLRHLPRVGVLTWVLQFSASWKLLNLALQTRIGNASSSLVGHAETPSEDTRTPVHVVSETGGQLETEPAEVESAEIKAISPEINDSQSEITPGFLWECTSGRRLTRECLEHGIESVDEIYTHAVRVLGNDIKRSSIVKALSAARKELANA